MVNSLSLHKPLQWISSSLQLSRVFFPGILMLAMGTLVFNNTIQGKDILLNAFQTAWSGWFFIIALLFWTVVTWYTSRLISYNNFRKIFLPEKGLTHFPRWLGFNCITIAFVAIASAYPPVHFPLSFPLIFLISWILYLLYNRLFQSLEKYPVISRNYNLKIIAWTITLFSTAWMAIVNKPAQYLILLPVLQCSLLFLITIRRNNAFHKKSSTVENANGEKQTDFLSRLIKWIYNNHQDLEQGKPFIRLPEEKNFFAAFLMLSLLMLGLYIATLLSVNTARTCAPLPILLLGFGLLLGAGNILSMLTFKLKINLHFLVIGAVALAGFFRETHDVNLQKLEKNLPLHTARPKLRPHFNRWITMRRQELNQTDSTFPVYLVLTDGGASRSAYWSASVLAQLDSLAKGQFYNHLFSLSGSSGGSLGNLTFLAAQQLPAETRLASIQNYLSADFLSYPLAYLMGADFLLPLLPDNMLKDRAAALEKSMTETGKSNPLDQFMQSGFSSLNPAADSNLSAPVVFINCTRMQDGNPAAVSNIQLDKKTFGQRIDVLRELGAGFDLSIAAGIVLGARFPFFSPAGRIHNNYFVDAGYMDNSGAGITHEMLLDLHALINDSLRIKPDHPYGKIRFNIVHITNDPASKPVTEKIHPLVNDLAAPILTLTNAHTRQTDINNLRLKKYLQEINGDGQSYEVINLYENGLDNTLPMNWILSPAAIEKINTRLSELLNR